jgi:hypothetical protein
MASRGARSNRKHSARHRHCERPQQLVTPRAGGVPSKPRRLDFITIVSGILDHPPARMMTTESFARVQTHCPMNRRSKLSNSPPRRDPSQPRLRDLAACFTRGLISNLPPSSTEGAGNAGCALHPWPPVQQKSTGVSNQGYTASTGIPCTMVFRLIRDLPGDHACLPPSSADRSAHLTPASERQDHAISPSAAASFVAQ